MIWVLDIPLASHCGPLDGLVNMRQLWVRLVVTDLRIGPSNVSVRYTEAMQFGKIAIRICEMSCMVRSSNTLQGNLLQSRLSANSKIRSPLRTFEF